MNKKYDIVVVGAGPAGSTAARFAAQSGASVLLLEKDREIGIPVRCAEGVGEKGLETVVKIKPHWIAQEVSGVTLVSPSEDRVDIESNEMGYVLNRKIFDYELAQMAATAGANVLTRAYVHGLLFQNGKAGGVRLQHLDSELEVEASIVIGADGIESRVGRWAGLKTKTSMKDMETCAQVTASHIDVDGRYCQFYFSNEKYPGGYLWIFPKGNGLANVGLGISGEYSKHKSPLACLQDFLDARFPHASILTTVAGGVPCSPTLEQIVGDGLMLVGDAAHQANPVSGGGITSGMIAAKIAGQVAGAAIAEGNVSKKRLTEYVNLWNKAEGNKHKVFYKLKKFVYNLSDEELDNAARILLDMPKEKRTLVNIFKSALIKHPSLIVDIIKAFA
ncbi:MAG: geranylgeranyl reductase family protein [Actinobacteria bacterium]|nr:geranylgeranyl reductase family protein [Actinomycetota bacterium]